MQGKLLKVKTYYYNNTFLSVTVYKYVTLRNYRAKSPGILCLKAYRYSLLMKRKTAHSGGSHQPRERGKNAGKRVVILKNI